MRFLILGVVFILLVAFGVYIFYSVFRPDKLIAMYARFSQRYLKRNRKMTDEEIDAMVLGPGISYKSSRCRNS